MNISEMEPQKLCVSKLSLRPSKCTSITLDERKHTVLQISLKHSPCIHCTQESFLQTCLLFLVFKFRCFVGQAIFVNVRFDKRVNCGVSCFQSFSTWNVLLYSLVCLLIYKTFPLLEINLWLTYFICLQIPSRHITSPNFHFYGNAEDNPFILVQCFV